MKNISKYKVDISIILCIILFVIISIVTIGSAEKLLDESTNLVLKQIIWYVVGFIFVFFVMFIGNHLLYKNTWF
jgi:cell division protein FtsW (lipid II flippase)